MNQTFLSSPIQSAEVLTIYSKSLTEWVEGLFYHDLTELCMKKVHLGLPKSEQSKWSFFSKKDRVAPVQISLLL